ncbi:MAG: hypothetical protein K8T90_00085 [Planctomycetes bacterium]|nr:hypothetical protein [Planctomycetota bacterium]
MRASVRGRAKSIALALAALVTLVGGFSAADGPGAPGTTEAEFSAARLKDDLAGVILDSAKEVRIGFHASVGSTVTATLGPDARSEAAAATGLSLTLCRADGTDLSSLVAGHDISKSGGPVRWKNVPIDRTGDFTLIVRCTAAGTWRLQLAGALKTTTAVDSAVALASGGQDDVEFQGFARGTVSFALKPTTAKSKFKGEVVRIVQPDGFDLPGVDTLAKGKVSLLQDGPHLLVYRNTGSIAGDGTATASVTPPKLLRRTVYVRPAGAALVPIVRKIDPPRGYHKDGEFAATLTGRDFQPGADVRLVRNGRADIIGTAIEIASETAIRCVFDLDTLDTQPTNSVGSWKVGVWNAPEYTIAMDPLSLVRESLTRSFSLPFDSVSSASIALPPGVVKGAEVWLLDFNDDFQSDLNAMGLGSSDKAVRDAARGAVEAYVNLFLRDLFDANETTGALKKNASVPICFIAKAPGKVAGRAGEDYNRIEIGGNWQTGDAQDPAEPLRWGASGVSGSEIDFGNVHRNDLTVVDSNGTRIGLGARTGILDPALGVAASGWALSMQPLRSRPLTAIDRRLFTAGFFPSSQPEADRYKDVVTQVTRASREIAAIVAHHVGKAMGAEDGASTGPMSNPTAAGDLWPTTASLRFSDAELAALRGLAVPHALPGTTSELRVGWFPLVTTHIYRFGGAEECLTAVPYSARFGIVGGRPNALKADYKVQYVLGSNVPRGLTLSFDGLDGTAPLYADAANNVFYWGIVVFRIAVTDQVRNTTKFLQYRLDVIPNKPLLPTNLWPSVDTAINSVRTQ